MTTAPADGKVIVGSEMLSPSAGSPAAQPSEMRKPMRSGRRSRAVLSGWAVVVLVATAGCGSTVRQSSTIATQGGADAGLGGSAGSGAGVAGGPSGASVGPRGLAGGASSGSSNATTPSNVTGSTAGGASSGDGASPSSGSGSAGSPTTSSSAIRVGYLYSTDEQSALASAGLGGLGSGDTRAQVSAIAADVNKRGGIAGRRLVMIGYKVSTTDYATNPPAVEQAACAYFTQDVKVQVVLVGGSTMSPCLAKQGISTVGAGDVADPSTLFAQKEVVAGGMLIPVLAKAFVSRLNAQGFFSGWNTAVGQPGAAKPRIGILYPDDPLYVSYFRTLKADLAAQGYPVQPSDEVVYSNDANGASTQSSAAVLKFQSNGVTHVFGAAYFFFQSAQNQNYHPRYGFDSIVPPVAIASLVGKSQLHGALGIGYRPTWDVDAGHDPGPVSPQASRCTAIMRAAGQTDTTQRSVLYVMHSECEMIWMLAAAISVSGDASAAGIRSGFQRLGTPMPVLSFGERWAQDRLASNTTVSDLTYVDSCSCFAYAKTRTSF